MKKSRISTFGWVIIAFLAAVCIRFLLADFPKVMHIYPDEYRYLNIARSLWIGNGISIRNAPSDYQKLAYSVLLVPFWGIKDYVFRVRCITLFNCLLMSSAVFPLYLILKELKVKKEYAIVAVIMMLFYPDFNYTITFMAELLYWPIYFWYIYAWLKLTSKEKTLGGIWLGILSYIGYLCKEIFLASILAFVVLALYDALKEKRIGALQKNFFLSVITFLGIHIVLKLTVFYGMGNSYNQMSLKEVLSLDKILYMGYGFIYLLVAVCISLGIIPVVYSFINVIHTNEKVKRIFYFNGLYLFFSMATIAYTITVREDYGQQMPRLHFRYLGPSIVLFICLFLYLYWQTNEEREKKTGGIFSVAILVVSLAIFRGTGEESPVDEYILSWIKMIREKYNDFSDVRFYILVAALVVLMSFLFYIGIYQKKKRIGMSLFCSVYLFTFLTGNIYGYNWLKSWYIEDKDHIEAVEKLNDLTDNGSNMMYVMDFCITQTGMVVDSCFVNYNHLYMVELADLQQQLTSAETEVKSLNLYEPMWEENYAQLSEVKYIVVEKKCAGGLLLDNVEILPEYSTDEFIVYENADASYIKIK